MKVVLPVADEFEEIDPDLGLFTLATCSNGEGRGAYYSPAKSLQEIKFTFCVKVEKLRGLGAVLLDRRPTFANCALFACCSPCAPSP